MKPLIFEYLESSSLNGIGTEKLEYSEFYNLTLLKNTSEPAIKILNMDTTTFTKSSMEQTDSDLDYNRDIKNIMDSATGSRSNDEPSDSDKDNSELMKLLNTRTMTEAVEPTDSDK